MEAICEILRVLLANRISGVWLSCALSSILDRNIVKHSAKRLVDVFERNVQGVTFLAATSQGFWCYVDSLPFRLKKSRRGMYYLKCKGALSFGKSGKYHHTVSKVEDIPFVIESFSSITSFTATHMECLKCVLNTLTKPNIVDPQLWVMNKIGCVDKSYGKVFEDSIQLYEALKSYYGEYIAEDLTYYSNNDRFLYRGERDMHGYVFEFQVVIYPEISYTSIIGYTRWFENFEQYDILKHVHQAMHSGDHSVRLKIPDDTFGIGHLDTDDLLRIWRVVTGDTIVSAIRYACDPSFALVLHHHNTFDVVTITTTDHSLEYSLHLFTVDVGGHHSTAYAMKTVEEVLSSPKDKSISLTLSESDRLIDSLQSGSMKYVVEDSLKVAFPLSILTNYDYTARILTFTFTLDGKEFHFIFDADQHHILLQNKVTPGPSFRGVNGYVHHIFNSVISDTTDEWMNRMERPITFDNRECLEKHILDLEILQDYISRVHQRRKRMLESM